MKIRSALIAALLTTGLVPITASYANVKPIVESFTFTPNEVELNSANSIVSFELVVSHPAGIKNTTTQVTLTGPYGSTLATNLIRTDSPLNLTLNKVTFRGTLTIPQNINNGAYTVGVTEISNNSSAGYEYGTGLITPSKLRDLAGAESALLVRNNGELNLVYDTFVGPTHNTTLGIPYSNPSLYNNNNPPIWKVGETYTPSKYFESRVSSLPLVVTTSTPTICSSDGKELTLIATGSCTFKVATLKTKDYASKEVTQNIEVTSARIKPELVIGTIATQTSKNLPKTVEIFRVYSPTGTWVLPQATTPSVCMAADFYVKIISGGLCTLQFQSEETSQYLASKLYEVSFQVSRDPQTITWLTPNSLDIGMKKINLSASSSSGGIVTYVSLSPEICSISNSTLNLIKSGNCVLIAEQVGNSTFEPTSDKRIIRILGAKIDSTKSKTCSTIPSSKKSKNIKNISSGNCKSK